MPREEAALVTRYRPMRDPARGDREEEGDGGDREKRPQTDGGTND